MYQLITYALSYDPSEMMSLTMDIHLPKLAMALNPSLLIYRTHTTKNHNFSSLES